MKMDLLLVEVPKTSISVRTRTHKHSTLSLTDWSRLLMKRPSGAPISRSVPAPRTTASTPAPRASTTTTAPRASTTAPRASTTAPPAPTRRTFGPLPSAPVGLLNENGAYCYRNAGIHLLRNIPELFTTSKIMTGGAVVDFINAINPNLNPTLSSSRPIVDDYKACAEIWFPPPQPNGQQDPQEFIQKFLETAPSASLKKDIINIQLRTTKRLQVTTKKKTGEDEIRCVPIYAQAGGNDTMPPEIPPQIENASMLIPPIESTATLQGIINAFTGEERNMEVGINPGEYLYWYDLFEDNEYHTITENPDSYGFTRTSNALWYTPIERSKIRCCQMIDIVLPATNKYIIVNTKIMTSEDSRKGDITVDSVVQVAGQWYKVISMVLHNGTSTHSGHYTNLTHHNGKWFFLDDSRVTEMGELDPQTYIEDLRTGSSSRSTLQFVPYLILLKKVHSATINLPKPQEI
ncbi:hypothetical protein HK102_006970 [Quaeritorhiza haematococci]|nr:hypothetical protein HK102_006970 [Quaeritorhiza haematococci]